MTTTITSDLVEAYSLCPRKAFLLMTGTSPSPGPHDYEPVVREQADANRQAHRARLEEEGEVVPFGGPADLAAGRQVIADAELTTDILHARYDFLAKVAARLYLPADWAAGRRRRRRCHVPRGVPFQEGWRVALDLVGRCAGLPHGWVAGDDELGRPAAFRAALRRRGERYVLDVPANTLVRDLAAPRGGGRLPPFGRAEAWAARQPRSRWRRVEVRDGEKGRLAFQALVGLVQARDEDGRVGRWERLLVLRRADGEPQTWYALRNASQGVPLAELVRVKAERHRIEQSLGEAKGEVGLAHYEVRSWVGWHHHMALALVALWFLGLGRRRGGKPRP